MSISRPERLNALLAVLFAFALCPSLLLAEPASDCQ